MKQSCSERRMIIVSLCLIFCLSNSILVIAKDLCLPDQRDALWEFKGEFDFEGKTEKWRNNTDCCTWDGVSCDPKTRVVVELNLLDNGLNGPLRSNSSLFRLQHLQTLNLANNNISGILPDSIGNLKYLRSLNLGNCNLFGKIPSSLGNLSYLTDLDLSLNDFTGGLPYSMGNLNKLTELYLGSAKLSGNFPHVLLNLSSLTLIELQFNQFEGILPSNMSNLSKLESFEIVGNSFSGTIPSSLGNLSYLAHVFLNDNSFSGTIPSSLFMIPSLIGLDLARNYFSGLLEIGNISSLSKLQYLFLGENNFNGPIPRFISKLVNLQRLSLSFWNTGSGMVDFSIFLLPKSLWSLDLSYLNTRSIVDLSCFSHLMLLELDLSGINLKISSTLHFPSPMYTLILSSCNIYEFPKFLQNQTSLTYLDISANQIEGQVPDWLWRLPKLRHVNIAQNSFSGFEGSAEVIQRSGNLTKLPSFIEDFLGSDNQFSGEIPRTICELVGLQTLVLSNNNFSGSIPQCFENLTLSVLHLMNNSLSGVFPEESISVNLRSLDVGSNWLSGQLPKSLINCTDLEFLNVEDNRISDKFPFWLRSLPNLQILVLRSNKFYGPISSPGDSLSVPTLRIFDISENGFNGVLPSDYFVGWSAMSSVVDIYDNTPGFGVVGGSRKSYHNSVVLTNKGSKMELVGSAFTIYKTIDVSGNRLEGDIPESIGILKELIVLNLSNNAFTGHIPPSLSNLSNLQSLDISKNRLSGSISPELGKLTFLEWMNFSYNRLEGPIPQGTQIQSQNSSSFAENPGLCGAPLLKKCGGEEEEEESTKQEQDEDEEKEEKDKVFSWIAAAIGYVPGLFCGLAIGHILTSYKYDWFMRIFSASFLRWKK